VGRGWSVTAGPSGEGAQRILQVEWVPVVLFVSRSKQRSGLKHTAQR